MDLNVIVQKEVMFICYYYYYHLYLRKVMVKYGIV
jgi:hypothetical protein